MQPVTAAQIRAWSRVQFDELVGPVDDSVDPPIDPLEEEVTRAAALVQLTVGWFYDTNHLPPDAVFMTNPAMWILPIFYEPLMRQAIQLATEWEAYRNQPDQIEGIVDFDTVESFTTRGYSEVRRGHGRGVATFAALQAALHPWPRLAKLLASLMNPIRTQGDVPAVGAIGRPGRLAIRWDQGRYIIDAGRPGANREYLTGQGPYGAGPYSVYDMRPGGAWFVPGTPDGFWPD